MREPEKPVPPSLFAVANPDGTLDNVTFRQAFDADQYIIANERQGYDRIVEYALVDLQPINPGVERGPKAAQKLAECRMELDKAFVKRKRLFVSEETLKRRVARVPAHLLAWAVRRIQVLEEQEPRAERTVCVVQSRSWYEWINAPRGGWSEWEDLDGGRTYTSPAAAQSTYDRQVETQTEIVTTLKPKGSEHTTRQFRIVLRKIFESVELESAQIGPRRP